MRSKEGGVHDGDTAKELQAVNGAQTGGPQASFETDEDVQGVVLLVLLIAHA